MSTNKRPGVQAGIDLAAQPQNVQIWNDTEVKWTHLPIPNLHKLQKEIDLLSEKDSLTKDDLDKIVSWKFVVGKGRPSIRKLLHSNSDQNIEQHTQRAIMIAKNVKPENNEDAMNDALAELEQLKGIGPATASAVLSLVNPSVFCFMYDEVIDCFMPKRDYKRSTYLSVLKECQRLALSLNKADGSSSWTPSRVATVLWTACRDLAIQETTVPKQGNEVSKEKTSKREATDSKQKSSSHVKRRKV